ncbi:MAG: DUF2188 domain-containing protein [Acholeplasmataceae bacterium]
MLLIDIPFKDGNFGPTEWVFLGIVALILILVILLVAGNKGKKKEVKELIKETPPAKESPKPADKVEAKVEEEKPPVKEEPKKKPVLEESLDYHVTYFEDADPSLAGKWRVVRERSQRALKYFRTQAEAIEYANEIAANQGVGVVVYRKDGKIRKS